MRCFSASDPSQSLLVIPFKEVRRLGIRVFRDKRTHQQKSTSNKRLGMTTGRMEAFSDGVFAIIITIMVLGIQTPHGVELASLRPLLSIFLSYVLSFAYIGIYWNNHHHLLHAAERVDGSVLWANLHLLFWLSLTPFATDWMGANHFAPVPVALYGLLLLCSAIAYFVLTKVLMARQDPTSVLARSVGKDLKGTLSVVVYAAAIPLALISSWLACAGYILVAIIWLLPDPRIEKTLHEDEMVFRRRNK